MRTHDNRQQRFPTDRYPTGKAIQVPKKNARLALLETLNWFRYLPSDHCRRILELHGLKSLDGQKEVLTDYYHEAAKSGGHYLNRPSWQYPPKGTAWPNRHHHIIHELGDAGIKYLKDLTRYVNTNDDSHKYHGLMGNVIAAETYIGHTNRDNTFKPDHRVSPHKNEYEVTFEYNDKEFTTTLEPDYRFELDYSGRAALFFDEYDRYNEQTSGVWKGKKTGERMLYAYRAFIATRGKQHDRAKSQYRTDLNTELPAFVRFHYTSRGTMENVMKIADEITGGKGCNYMLFMHHADRFDGKVYDAPFYSEATYNGAYRRINRPDFYMNDPATW